MAAQDGGYKVKVDGFEFTFTDKEIDAADAVLTGGDSFHLIKDDRSLNVRIVERDLAGKKALVEIDGETHRVEWKDSMDQMLDNMGFNNVVAKVQKDVRAPMPGLVLEVSVEVGQKVSEGDRLLILEAMKMENSISIQTEAVIKKVLVKKGQPVEKNQVLIELE
jgi:biotin carboxyl carrier protein